MSGETPVHKQVLSSLTGLAIPGYEVHVEQGGGRIDLPNERFATGERPAGQRQRTLCYTDAILLHQGKPRVLIEVVDSSPTDPNGIAGLVVNVDRIAVTHAGIDLLFVVLAEVKAFYCPACQRGHRLSQQNLPCLEQQLQAKATDAALAELLVEGPAANYKKALVDYPIGRYLHHMAPPAVLFLNARRAREAWAAYEPHALALVASELQHLLAASPREAARLVAVEELLKGP